MKVQKMKIVNCIQGSDSWKELRALRMGASHAQAIAANGKGLESYLREKVRVYFSQGEEVRYKNANMDNGNEQEATAATLYEFETGRKTHKIGYVIHGECSGCSPDRGVGDDGLIEIKCPTDKVFFDLLLDKKIDTGYIWQMQMQMLVCEKAWCDYVVYNPNFKTQLVIVRFLPNEKRFDKLRIGIEVGTKRMIELLGNANLT